MFQTTGIQAVASITELHSKSTALVEHVRDSGTGVLIQRNNEPRAVLLSYEQYVSLTMGGKGGAKVSKAQTDGRATKTSSPKASSSKASSSQARTAKKPRKTPRGK